MNNANIDELTFSESPIEAMLLHPTTAYVEDTHDIYSKDDIVRRASASQSE